MNRNKLTNTIFALIITIMLLTSLTGVVAASSDDVAYLAGITWYDINSNGIREAIEPTASGIPVYMRPIGGEAGIAGGLVVFSDNEGVVDFGALAFGEYQVQVEDGEPFTVTLSETNSASTLEIPVSADKMPESFTQVFLPMVIR